MYYLNFIKRIFTTNYVRNDKKMLGRWNTVSDHKMLEHKIYLANHDHCGPCGKLKYDNNKNIKDRL